MGQVDDLVRFIGTNFVLIVDSSPTLRSSIAGVLSQLGVPGHQILLASDYRETLAHSGKFNEIGLLISDYLIGDQSGVELAQEVFAAKDQLNLFAVLILTSSEHQSNVVEAAEGLADAYLLKPFSADLFGKYLGQVIQKKLRPSEDEERVQEIRSLIRAHKYAQAIEAINLALNIFIPEKPMIYHYYQGKAYEGLSNLENAKKSFDIALGYQSKNFLALFGIFSVYRAQGRKSEAYDYLKRISKLFPLSPQRLCDALALAIETKHFNDVEDYYALFLEIDERRPSLVKTMNAALVVGAIHQFQQQRPKSGLELFRKAIMTSRRSKQIIFRSILYCLAYSQYSAAYEFMDRFESADQSSEQFLICHFLIVDLKSTGDTTSSLLEQNLALGVQLIRSNDCPIQVFRAVIQRARELGKTRIEDEATQVAISRWSHHYVVAEKYFMSDEEESKRR